MRMIAAAGFHVEMRHIEVLTHNLLNLSDC